MNNKIIAVILALLAAAFVWQAFAQTPSPETPCVKKCKAEQTACEKEAPDDMLWKLSCLYRYNDCVAKCK